MPKERHEKRGEFRELLTYTAAGYLGGTFVGAVLDRIGFQASAVGQWAVRTLAGEGESVFEGAFALRRRIRRAKGSMAEAYGWGKLLGMFFPWIVDWGSRIFGVDVYGASAFYIPYFYAMSDQIGGNVSGLVYLRRREKSWAETLRVYLRSPVMMSSLAIVLLVPAGLFIARAAGFSPRTQLLTAFETIVANLCWLPPLLGWLKERSESKRDREGSRDDDSEEIKR